MTRQFIRIATGLIFAWLIVGMGIMQMHLKNMPQIIMLIWGIFTLAAFAFRHERVSTILFYLLIGFMLFINISKLYDLVLDILYPDRDWIEVDGNRYQVMSNTWMAGILLGLLLSPLLLFLYHKGHIRSRTMEIWTTAIFLVVTAVVYILYEQLNWPRF